MEFKYLKKNCKHPLIDQFYKLTISENDLPFKTLIMPLGQTNITYVFCENYQIAKLKNKEIFYKGLVLTGQIYKSYHLEVKKPSENLGFALKPTALYKILNKDISKFNNNHQPLQKVSKKLYIALNDIFLNRKSNDALFMKSIYKVFDNFELSKDPNIKYIDKAVAYIIEKGGLLRVNDLLQIVPFSQKSLETQFKKIIGLTPGKYIRQHRFINLMLKYGSNKYDISDLIYMFDYYDSSHFAKDFKMFLGQTPKKYFKQDYPLIKRYLKE